MEEKDRLFNFLFYIFVVISLLFLILKVDVFVNNLKLIFSFVFNPSFSIKTINQFEKIDSNIKSLLYTKLKEKELEIKISDLNSKLIYFNTLLDENKRLNELINAQKNISYSGRFSRIISINPKNPYSFIYVDKGMDNGVKIYNPVLFFNAGKWFIIGRVSEVYKNFSKIILITNSNFSFIADTKNSRGLISGNLTKNLLYKYVSGDFKLGDDLVTSKVSITFPPSLLVGKIIDKNSGSDFFSKEGEADCFDISSLDYVYILDWQPYITDMEF
ncbi:MAG: rod shape-determining protein MreC [Elusimicrobiota bacterium]